MKVFHSRDGMLFLLFLTVLGLLYIYNSYSYRDKLRELKRLTDSLEATRLRYYYTLSRFAYSTRESILESLATKKIKGLSQESEPPQIVEIEGRYLSQLADEQ